MSEATTGTGRVAYVLKGYPRLSEVFITSEIYRVERLGVPLRLYVHQGGRRGRPPRRRTPGADAARVPAAADVADQGAAARWLAQNRGLFLPAVVRTGRRHPVGLARAAGQALAQAVRARRSSGRLPASSTSSSSCAPSTWPTGSTVPGTWPGSTPTSRTAPRRSPGWPRRSPACRSRSPATPRTSTPRSSTPRACCDARWTPPRSSSPAPRPTAVTCRRSARARPCTCSTTA